MMRGLERFATPRGRGARPFVEVCAPSVAANMTGMKKFLSVVCALVSAAITPAHADPSEIRLGVSAHDIGLLGSDKEDGLDVNGEVLFEPPAFLRPAGSPRPHVGMSVNTSGDTSQVYAGLTWAVEPDERWFAEFSFGTAVHDGELHDNGHGDKALGSRVLFRGALAVGYRLDRHASVSLVFDHESNAGLADDNEGLNNLGLRWGYRF